MGARPDTPLSGSERAQLLAGWSQTYGRALFLFFQRRTPAHVDREDLVQEVFVRLAHRDQLSDIEHVDRYLFHAAGNVLTDWRRRQTVRASGAHQPIDETLADVGCSPERVLVGKDNLRAMIGALETLPTRTRVIFMLYHFEQLPQVEIGRRLNVAVRTVEDHIARANKHLLTALRDQDA